MKSFVFKCLVLAFTLAAIVFFACQRSQHDNLKNSEDQVEVFKRGPGNFIQAHRMIRTLDGHSQPAYKAGDIYREFSKAKLNAKSKFSEELEWIERGPSNVGGRTRGLVVDPSDTTAHTWFLASVGGGIWKTTNAGEDWELLTEDFTSLATSTIAMAPSNQDVIYVGTGEGFGNIDGIVGQGIWKSTDRGETWNLLESTRINEFANVTRLIVNPDDENEVLACTRTTIGQNVTRTFILKSTDGGETWVSKYARSSTIVQQLVPSPNNFDIIYATVRGVGVLQSTDRGETWEEIWQTPNEERRIEMAISPKDDGVIYLSCELARGSRLYFTRDTFNTVIEPIYKGRQPDWLVEQGWYDNTIAVHPYNDSIVWVAGQGPVLEIRIGQDSGIVKTFSGYNSLAPFIKPVENSPFNDEPAGTSVSLFEGLPVSTEFTEEDIIDVELRFGQGSSKAHLISVNVQTFDFRFQGMIDVPFQAWDVANDRQIAISVYDVDNNGEWSFENYTDQPNPFHDVVITNNIDYSETPDPIISGTNPVYKTQYYIFMGRSPSYNGSSTELPFGFIFFNTEEEEGLISEFTPIADGYFAYTDISNVGTKGVHVDHHNIIFIPRDSASGLFYVLNANDGGVAFSEDSGDSFSQTGDSYNDGSFISLYGYNTSQFYGIDKKNGESRYVGGTQDNGSWVSPSDPDTESIWIEAPSGDGFEAAWHYENPSLVLETSQFNRLYKSYNEGISWNSVDLPESDGPFITRLASSQINPDLIFMVSDTGVLRSDDFAETWEIIDMPDTWEFQGSWGPPITISLADANYVWTGSRVNSSSRVCYSVDGGLSFEQTRSYTATETGLVTGLATHPNDPNTAYVLFSQKGAPKILMTNDLGQSWTDLSGYGPNSQSSGFPDVAVYCLLVMPWEETRLWAGTEIGIFESLDGGLTWSYADNGFPAISVWQMKIVNDEIVLATHGRGIWTVNLAQFDVSSTDENNLPLASEVQIYPNPMSNQSQLVYTTTESQTIEISIYALNGQKIRTLFQGRQVAGEHQVQIRRETLEAGIYFVNIQSESQRLSKKLFVQ